MKIIYLHQYFNTPTMPGGTRSYEMARRMVAAGHEVHMITSHCEGPAPVKVGRWYETQEAGIQVHWLVNPYSNRMGFGQRIRAFIRFALRSSARAAKLGGDVVFATSTPLTIAIPALYAKWRNRIPMVFEVRDLWPEAPIAVGALRNPASIALARSMERRAYFGATHVVALSPGMRDGVIATGYPASQVSVIPNSSDVNLFRVPPDLGATFLQNQPELSGGPLIIYAGALGLINGVSYLIDIADQMQEIAPCVRFLIVGDGREQESIRTYAEKAGVLNRNLWMIRRVPKKEMPAVLSASTLAVSLKIDLPEIRNNSANKVFDAFAAGRPVAINHDGWIADILNETGAGIVLPPRNAHVAAEQLAIFLHDNQRLEQARAAARQLADERFNRDLLAGQLIDVIEAAALSARRRPLARAA